MITKFLKFTGSLLIILTCAGCLKTPIQRPKNLKPLTKETAHDSQTKEQVTVYAKKLSFEDQQNMFGNCAKQLEKHHIVPVQITVENNGTIAWLLADKNLTIQRLTLDEVNKTLFASRRWIPLWIFLGGVAGTIIIAPLIGLASCPLLFYTSGCYTCCGKVAAWLFSVAAGTYIATVTAGVVLATTTSIAIADGIANHMSKKQMHEYLKNNCYMDGITINPDITASMIFFVEESQLPEKLNLMLTDKNLEAHVLPFELAL